jgi:hypothetical protein
MEGKNAYRITVGKALGKTVIVKNKQDMEGKH